MNGSEMFNPKYKSEPGFAGLRDEQDGKHFIFSRVSLNQV